MTIHYVQFTVSVHGLEADADMLPFLNGWIKEATKAGLLGGMREHYKFRNEFEDDIVVEVAETAGSES